MYWTRIPAWRGIRLCTYRLTPFFAATAILTITPQTVWSCCQSGKARLRSREVETFHDDRGGALRGTNTVRIFTAGGLSAVHLGDLGHQLTAEQAAAIGRWTPCWCPVGGVYTVDAAGAKAVCDALHPRCVVPMHYHHAPYGLTEVDSVEPFLELWPAEEVHHLQGAAFELTEQTAGVMVPSF